MGSRGGNAVSITSCASRRNEPTAHGENRISNVVSDEGASVPDLGVTAKTPSDASSSTSHSYGNGTSDRFATATVRTDAQPGTVPPPNQTPACAFSPASSPGTTARESTRLTPTSSRVPTPRTAKLRTWQLSHTARNSRTNAPASRGAKPILSFSHCVGASDITAGPTLNTHEGG